MSICNEKYQDKPSTSRQIFSHVKKSKTQMHDVRNLLLDILEQYQKADKLGLALGVIDKTGSFSDAVSWCSIIGRLDKNKESLDEVSKQHLVTSVEHLENMVKTFEGTVVSKIQKCRDKWMLTVLLLDALLIGSVFFVSYFWVLWSGVNVDGLFLSGFIQERPVFSAIFASAVVMIFLKMHFLFRDMAVSKILIKNKGLLPLGMSMLNALKINVKKRHSIFRPNPVGWGIVQKSRLKSIEAKMSELHSRLDKIVIKAD